jgi:hypothetical protein
MTKPLAVYEEGAMEHAEGVSAQVEMPKYRCFKEVHALKIAAIAREGGVEANLAAAVITPAEEGYAPFRVDAAYMLKHQPQIGGYYVVYADGYQSFSPAKAFEDGYVRI